MSELSGLPGSERYDTCDNEGQEGVRCVAKNKITERKQDESISIQGLW